MSGVKYTKTIYQHQQSCEVTAANTYPSLPLNNHRSWWVFLQNSFEQQAILYYLTLNTFHRFDFFMSTLRVQVSNKWGHTQSNSDKIIYTCVYVYICILYIYLFFLEFEHKPRYFLPMTSSTGLDFIVHSKLYCVIINQMNI